MTSLRRILAMSLIAVALLGVSAAPSSAVVGGGNASPGEYPSVAEVTFGPFLCTGTLITPDWVLSAGHCGSITGAAVASPASWPPQLINVRIGGVTQSDGEQRSASQVIVHPNYLATSGYDISLIRLSQSSTMAPTQVAGAGERSIWTAGTLETIVGWGATEEGGDLPDNLQEARVPITTDAYCAGAYSDFDPATMVCAGFPGRRGHLPGRLGRPDVRQDVDRRPARGRHHELRRGLRAAGQAGRVRPRRGRDATALDRADDRDRGEQRREPSHEEAEDPPRQATRCSAPLGAEARQLSEPGRVPLEHERDQQDDQDDQKDRSNADVHGTPSLVGVWFWGYLFPEFASA
jgi:hypothetical protein